MSTSPTTALFDPTSTDKISLGTFGYIRARNRQSIYNLVIREFRKSGLSQADLARRMGKTADVVCRFFARPRNWEIDTASDYLFAISGAALKFESQYPATKSISATTAKTDPNLPPTRSERPEIPKLNWKSNNPNVVIIPLPIAA